MPPKKKKSAKVDKRYRGRVRIGVDDYGVPIYKYISGRTKAELEEARDAVKEFYVTGSKSQSSTTFEKYAWQWLELYKRPNLKPTTMAGYESTLRNHIVPEFAGRQIRAISPADIQSFVNRYRGRRKGTVNEVMVCLKQIFRRAFVDGLIDRDPAYAVERPKTVSVKREAISPEFFPAIKKTIEEHPEGLLIALLFYAGLRKGEALGLEWQDINFKARLINVRRGQVYVKGKIVIYEELDDPLKTDAAYRDIPIPPPLLKLLIANRRADGIPVIIGPRTGGHLPQETYKRKWNRLMEHSGLIGKDITAHNFRHTYATLLHQAQVDQKTAQYVLGHEDYYTTAQIYTHIQDAQIESARAKIDAVFS